MGTTEGHDLTVIESHAVKDGAKMVFALRCIGEAAIGCAEGDVTVLAARTPRYDWTLHLLNSAYTGKSPKVRVRDPREFLCRCHVSNVR